MLPESLIVLFWMEWFNTDAAPSLLLAPPRPTLLPAAPASTALRRLLPPAVPELPFAAAPPPTRRRRLPMPVLAALALPVLAAPAAPC